MRLFIDSNFVKHSKYHTSGVDFKQQNNNFVVLRTSKEISPNLVYFNKAFITAIKKYPCAQTEQSMFVYDFVVYFYGAKITDFMDLPLLGFRSVIGNLVLFIS